MYYIYVVHLYTTPVYEICNLNTGLKENVLIRYRCPYFQLWDLGNCPDFIIREVSLFQRCPLLREVPLYGHVNPVAIYNLLLSSSGFSFAFLV